MPFGLSLPQLPRLPGQDLVAAPLKWATDTVGKAAEAPRWAISALAGLAGVRRSTWTYPGRIHLELRCPILVEQSDAIESALCLHPSVRWARVNLPLKRVIVAVDEPASVDELVAILDEAEQTAVEKDPALAEGTSGGPPAALVLAADAVGLAVTGVEWLAHRAPLPPGAAGVVGYLSAVPQLRKVLDDSIPACRSWMPLVNSTFQTLAPGGTGLAIDLVHRVLQIRQSRLQDGVWVKKEEALTGTPERAEARLQPADRPRRMPGGPIERHADHVLSGSAIGSLAGSLLTGNMHRGLEVALAGLPKASSAGRDAFATELGTLLSQRGVVITDPRALGFLDRVDTVVLDRDALISDDVMIGEVATAPKADQEAVATQVYALFVPSEPERVQRDTDWALGPYDGLPRKGGWAGKRYHDRFVKDGSAVHVLALTRRERLQAVVEVVRQQAPEAHALTVAARHAGLRLITRDGGADLAASVRQLQQEGAVVLLLSRDREALGAADCSIGVSDHDGRPPWGADLVVGADLTTAALIIESARTARTVSERGVTLAKAGTGVAAIYGLTDRMSRATGHVLSAVNGVAALSLAQGAWQAHQTMRRPTAPALPTTPWHAMPGERVLAVLETHEGGLTTAEAEQRRRARKRAASTWETLARGVGAELSNPFTPILAAGAAGSAVLGSVVDAALILGVMGVSALVGGVQRTATAATLAELSARTKVRARVLRDGEERLLEAADLVPGDVIVLDTGEVVPADCRILDADGLETDESSLTGESLPVSKAAKPVLAPHVAERRSMLYEGTTIAAGSATAVVVAVGDATEAGSAMAATAGAERVSGVEERLAAITRATTPIAIGSALGVTLSGLGRGRALKETLGEGVNLAVASVPEGLPLLVSAAQLAATRRLAARGVHARNPGTIEALGRVEVLCFDKTGTLTEGRIRLAKVSDVDHDRDVTDLDDELREVLAAALRATPHSANGDYSHLTDEAVGEGAAEVGVSRRTGADEWEEIDSLLFESSRGYHAALGRSGESRVLSVKGAPEVVLPRCAGLDGDRRADIEARIEYLASSGHRVLAVAERPMDDTDRLDDDDVDDLTFTGLVGLADVVRDTAVSAVAALRNAGVQIVMLTGDHPGTAGSIARHVTDDTDLHVLTGPDIESLDDARLDEVLPTVDVVARCTPAHKVRVVASFQRLGKVVAMAGDGSNDAAGIRLADIGIALGSGATPAAQAAADLVVADESLETIISTLVEGRAMWASVREALAILVGGNLGEIGFTLLGSLATGRSPLTARQLLLVNMLTDLAPALAIAVRAPSQDAAAALLDEGPESSLGPALTHDIVRRAIFTTVGAGTGWTLARLTGPQARARTVGLVSLVGTQLAQTLVAGGPSRAVLLSSLGSAAMLAAVVQLPGIGQFFGCVPLDPLAWGIAMAAIATAVLAERLVPLDRLGLAS
ncbi:cation-translocating P-type ATPase [Nonomuraea africana]|uniref:Magnesium-transporting ATPase (P-type) n=1 Tax=Nonomuraea africana TaxID=46171 RepID=A0ABR9KSZ0_9ACTN|nr:cation-transporting P-type ATPase [Nonomuraea africana]MBE1565158.1 magnesium-transporting ATPase (P-type) [Nonomuraea africana]